MKITKGKLDKNKCSYIYTNVQKCWADKTQSHRKAVRSTCGHARQPLILKIVSQDQCEDSASILLIPTDHCLSANPVLPVCTSCGPICNDYTYIDKHIFYDISKSAISNPIKKEIKKEA